MSWTRKSSPRSNSIYQGRRRFQHWYRDNQVYFITARCRDRFPAFASDDAKRIRRYPHTRVNVEMEQALAEAVRLHAFLVGVPYRRYEGRGGGQGR